MTQLCCKYNGKWLATTSTVVVVVVVVVDTKEGRKNKKEKGSIQFFYNATKNRLS